jgi:hypothetical protein
MPRFRCPGCGYVGESGDVQSFECPDCRARLRIPVAKSEPPPTEQYYQPGMDPPDSEHESRPRQNGRPTPASRTRSSPFRSLFQPHPADSRSVVSRMMDTLFCLIFAHSWGYGEDERGGYRVCGSCGAGEKWCGPPPRGCRGEFRNRRDFSDFVLFFPPGGRRSGDGFHRFGG